MSEGVDYSYGRPGGAALVKAGKKFVCRYINYPGSGGKGLAQIELTDLQTHLVAVVLNFEWYKLRPLEGYAAGVADAKVSKAQATLLGFPDDTPIYFSVDFSPTADQHPAIDAYLKGAASVLGLARIGVYGSYAFMVHCRNAKVATWFWQTYAWSYGYIAAFAHIYQYNNGELVNGEAVDLDRSLQPLFGQWSPLPASSTIGGDMAISTGGLTLTSQQQIVLPPGTLIFENAVGGSAVLMKTPAVPTAYDYFGSSGGFHAVRVDPPNSTTVIAFTTSAASVVDKPVAADPTPFTQADVDAAVAQALANAAGADITPFNQADLDAAKILGAEAKAADIRLKLGL